MFRSFSLSRNNPQSFSTERNFSGNNFVKIAPRYTPSFQFSQSFKSIQSNSRLFITRSFGNGNLFKRQFSVDRKSTLIPQDPELHEMRDQIRKDPAQLQKAMNEVQSHLSDMLKQQNFEPNGQDENGMSPLHWASLTGNTDLMRQLIERNADVTMLDDNGAGALTFAVGILFHLIQKLPEISKLWKCF